MDENWLGSTLGMYDGAEVGSLDGSTDGTADGEFDALLLGSRLGSDEDLELWGSLSFFEALGLLSFFEALGLSTFYGAFDILLPMDGALGGLVFGDLIVSILTFGESFES